MAFLVLSPSRSFSASHLLASGLLACCLQTAPVLVLFAADPAPVETSQADEALQKSLSNQLLILNVGVSQRAPSVALYSQRGDIHFFLGRFAKAVADYQEMVKLDPQQEPDHWRLGLALYYSGKFKDAADQFRRYHAVDAVDRENGIWHYFSQWKLEGQSAARQQMLKYETPDREPLSDVYRMLSGELTSTELLNHIQNAKLESDELQKRLFYANLYLGMNETLENHPAAAKRYLQQAADSPWARQADYGPRYMWHVARLQLQQLILQP